MARGTREASDCARGRPVASRGVQDTEYILAMVADKRVGDISLKYIFTI